MEYRNTPTHVGKTVHLFVSEELVEKHPHARGGDFHQRRPRAARRETPPRTWGRRTKTSKARVSSRNTPTHVGKTRLCSSRGASKRKHPHARGEDFPVPGRPRIQRETPPRTWGRLTHSPSNSRRLRNTPTHVGKTEAFDLLCVVWRKHPHARGEDRTYSMGPRHG